MAYYLDMLPATQFNILRDLAVKGDTTPDQFQDRLTQFGKKPNSQEDLVTQSMFISDVVDYANRPGANPLKSLSNEQWFNLVKLLNSRLLKTEKTITDKFSPEQKRALNITASLERYPTVARILNA
jgi:hypothetical protein